MSTFLFVCQKDLTTATDEETTAIKHYEQLELAKK